MAVISNEKYIQISELYASAVKQTQAVADYYYSAALLILYVDDFSPELDLLKPFYQAYLTALTAYAGYPGSTVDAVIALQKHVLNEARYPNTDPNFPGERFANINDWYAYEGITVDGCFANVSDSGGYLVNDSNCTGGDCTCVA